MFDTKTRVALWNANQRKCFYCSEPILFKDLEIDHIVPEKIGADDLIELGSRISLPADFGLNALCNLVPTHHNCNNRKGGSLMDDQAIVCYQQLWAKKQLQIHGEIEKHIKAVARDRYLIAVSRLIEAGEITKQEIWQVISKIQPAAQPTPQDPLVVTFGTNVSKLLESQALPKSAGNTYAAICDWLEKDLSLGFRVRFQLSPISRKPQHGMARRFQFESHFGTSIWTGLTSLIFRTGKFWRSQISRNSMMCHPTTSWRRLW